MAEISWNPEKSIAIDKRSKKETVRMLEGKRFQPMNLNSYTSLSVQEEYRPGVEKKSAHQLEKRRRFIEYTLAGSRNEALRTAKTVVDMLLKGGVSSEVFAELALRSLVRVYLLNEVARSQPRDVAMSVFSNQDWLQSMLENLKYRPEDRALIMTALAPVMAREDLVRIEWDALKTYLSSEKISV